MSIRPWSRLILAIVILSVTPLIPAADAPRSSPSEPWPSLLMYEQANIDPSVAALHQRANESLEKLIQLASLDIVIASEAKQSLCHGEIASSLRSSQ